MSEESAFRSSHPDVLAAWADSVSRRQAWTEAVGRFVKENPDHKGLETSWATRLAFVGLRGEEKPGPEWRYVSERDFWVPDKRTKAGKALSQQCDELAIFGLWNLPGMPTELMIDNHRLLSPGGFEAADGTIWLHWGCSAERVGTGSPLGGSDLNLEIWESAPLSAYHLALETRTALATAGS